MVSHIYTYLVFNALVYGVSLLVAHGLLHLLIPSSSILWYIVNFFSLFIKGNRPPPIRGDTFYPIPQWEGTLRKSDNIFYYVINAILCDLHATIDGSKNKDISNNKKKHTVI